MQRKWLKERHTPWESQAGDSGFLDRAVTYVPRAHLSSTPIHLFFEFLAADGYSAVKTRDRHSTRELQQTCFYLTKEASVLEESALEGKGQFHIPDSDISELRDVNEVVSCYRLASAPSTEHSTV